MEAKQISHPSSRCKRSGLFLTCLFDQVLKTTTKKGFLHRQPSLLLFPWSSYFLCQTWKSSAAVSDNVEKCLHGYSCLCSLAKESKLAQVHLPSAHCWYVDHGARWGNGLHVWKTLFSFLLLSALPLSPPSFVPWYFGSLGCHAFDSYWLVQITML